MFIRVGEAHPRSLIKAVSWRIVGSMDTFLLSLLFTHHVGKAASIASTEVLTKILLYYFHERAWAVLPWGRADRRSTTTPALSEGAAPAA